MNTATNKYPLVIRVLHWVMALVIFGLIGVGIYMTDLPKDDPSRGFFYGLHKSFGVTILLLVVLRVLVRLMSCIPSLPDAFSSIEKKIIHAGHIALYVLMFLTPLAGYLLSSAAGKDVLLFGLALPSLMEANKAVAEAMGEAHEILAYILLTVAVVHILAVIKHARDKNPQRHILKRMK